MVVHYSELQGAFGRAALYRPRRYRPKELLSPLANPRLRVGGEEYPVVDMSSNGAAILLPATEAPWPVGSELDACLVLHGLEAQRLRARVARVEPVTRGTRVGLSLTAGFLDLESARRVDARVLLDYQLTSGPSSRGSLIPFEFKEAVADAVHFVQYYRHCLEPHESEASSLGAPAVLELASKTYRWVAPRYAELREQASLAAAHFLDDPKVLAAAKSYTETMLTPLLLSAPIIWRTYKKPLGYPGDFQVMLYSYGNTFEGDTVFAKVFHKLYVEHPLSAGVCTRKDYVVSWIKRELARVDASSPSLDFSITSLGCGPAREVSDFIAAQPRWDGRMRWRLIDQEERTLEIAHKESQRALAKTSSRGSVECLNLSFVQLLKKPAPLTSGGPQHLIFSTGLFDYLDLRTAQRLISTLYACLEPGGLLLIGNARGPNDYFFCLEFVVDWSLIYRTREDMLQLAQVLPSDAHVDVELEPGRAYWFLLIRKDPGAAPER